MIGGDLLYFRHETPPGVRTLLPGDTVRFSIAPNPGGRNNVQAVNLTLAAKGSGKGGKDKGSKGKGKGKAEGQKGQKGKGTKA